MMQTAYAQYLAPTDPIPFSLLGLRTRGLKGRDFTGLDHQNAALTGLGVVSFGFPGRWPGPGVWTFPQRG